MQRWKRHEILFRAGDPMSSFFKIREGVVAVSRTLDDGRRQIVAVRSAGECVGYLESEGRYAFEGHALTEVQACAFDRRGFDAMIADNPDLAAALAEALSQALTQSAQSILVMGKLRSIERVAHFLAEMVLVHRHSHTNSGPLHLHMSRTEIADYLGLTVETVSRSIGKLKKRSVISLVDSDEVIVLNDSLLREIGKTDDKTLGN